jgi:hypothetical protein
LHLLHFIYHLHLLLICIWIDSGCSCSRWEYRPSIILDGIRHAFSSKFHLSLEELLLVIFLDMVRHRLWWIIQVNYQWILCLDYVLIWRLWSICHSWCWYTDYFCCLLNLVILPQSVYHQLLLIIQSLVNWLISVLSSYTRYLVIMVMSLCILLIHFLVKKSID